MSTAVRCGTAASLRHAPRWGVARSTLSRRPTCRSRLMITLFGEVGNERGPPFLEGGELRLEEF